MMINILFSKIFCIRSVRISIKFSCGKNPDARNKINEKSAHKIRSHLVIYHFHFDFYRLCCVFRVIRKSGSVFNRISQIYQNQNNMKVHRQASSRFMAFACLVICEARQMPTFYFIQFCIISAAPFCYIFDTPEQLYFTFRAFYIRYCHRLTTINTHPQGIVSLCLLFEKLLQTHEPQLWSHFRELQIQP